MKNKALDANLDFDGMAGDGVNRAGNRWAGNQSSLEMKENYGLKASARRGNASDSSADRREQTGPSVTKDKAKQTIATAGQGGKINGGARVDFPSNPDKINVGSR